MAVSADRQRLEPVNDVRNEVSPIPPPDYLSSDTHVSLHAPHAVVLSLVFLKYKGFYVSVLVAGGYCPVIAADTHPVIASFKVTGYGTKRRSCTSRYEAQAVRVDAQELQDAIKASCTSALFDHQRVAATSCFMAMKPGHTW